MTIPVPYYGLHTTPEGVVYLHQGRGSNNFIGLKASSPFTVSPRKNMVCPHLISANAAIPDALQWQEFVKVLSDPLVQALLPTPKLMGEMIPYVNDPQNDLLFPLIALSRMSGPIYPVVVALSKMTKTQILNELAITNTCPLILTGVRCEDNNFINEIVQQAAFMPRRLVLTGEAEVVIRPPMKRIVTNLWYVDAPILMGLPLESMGALILRRFARGERLDYDIVKGNVA